MTIRSMRLRMTLLLVALLAPFLVISSHLLIRSSRHGEADKTKLILTEALAQARQALGQRDWRPALERALANLDMEEHQIGALVADTSGRILWRTPTHAPPWPNPGRALMPASSGDLTFYLNTEHMLLYSDQGYAHLLALSGLAVVAFGLGAWFLVGRTLSPIRALARQASGATAKNLGTRLEAPSQDQEMQELVTTLNDFLSRMEEASEEKGRFYAAASHELRTPLQALSGHLEVALTQSRTAEEYAVTVQEAHMQTQRLVSLVEAILLLHQLQERPSSEQEAACVTALVEEALERLAPLIEARELTMEVSLEPNVTAVSAPMHLSVLVRNLMENAVKYAREGSVCKVNLSQATGLRIANEAPNGRKIDVERLFEPFYRIHASRSTKTGGNGLGLAICQEIAKVNDWQLQLCQSEGVIVASLFFA